MADKPYKVAALVETIAEASEAAEKKCMLGFGQIMALGVIAAGYLALATTLSIAVGAGIELPGVQKLVMGAVFPVGLIAVLMAVSELSTGNYLTAPLGAMMARIGWRHTFYVWAGSYAGNFLGAFIMAAIIIHGAHIFVGPMWGEQWVALLKKYVTVKAHLAPMEAFWRGVLCIWLVDLAVWQAYRVKDTTSKFLLIWFPTFAFFTLGLEHSVVNMFIFPAAIFAGADITWSDFMLHNLTPVVMGNIVGGVFIVGMLYWYSAGLPVEKPIARLGSLVGGHGGSNVEMGNYRLLGLHIGRGVLAVAIAVALLPGVGAGLSVLLPAEAGIVVPLMVIVYLTTLAYVLSLVFRKPPKPTPQLNTGPEPQHRDLSMVS